MHQLTALIGIVALCAGWAVFQLWLSKHDPEANQRLRKCGDCNCDSECENRPLADQPEK